MTTPTLLIYIPSYNRYDRLCEQLELITPHLDNYPISVIINNNASIDSRYKDLKIKYPHPNITINHNIANLGANPNILNGYVISLPYDYVWVLSDDDTITLNAIPEIMSRLSCNVDLFYFRLDNSNEKQDRYLMEDLLDNMNHGLGLISCAILRTATIRDSVKYGYEYLTTGFPHLAIMFSACNENKSLSVLEVPATLILKNKIRDQPVESKLAYVHSIFGFINLVDLIKNNDRKHKFIYDWIISDFNLWSIVEYKYIFPERYRNLKGFVFMQSPLLFIYFMLVCTIMSALIFIWNHVSLPNRKRLKSLIYP